MGRTRRICRSSRTTGSGRRPGSCDGTSPERRSRPASINFGQCAARGRVIDLVGSLGSREGGNSSEVVAGVLAAAAGMELRRCCRHGPTTTLPLRFATAAVYGGRLLWIPVEANEAKMRPDLDGPLLSWLSRSQTPRLPERDRTLAGPTAALSQRGRFAEINGGAARIFRHRATLWSALNPGGRANRLAEDLAASYRNERQGNPCRGRTRPVHGPGQCQRKARQR